MTIDIRHTHCRFLVLFSVLEFTSLLGVLRILYFVFFVNCMCVILLNTVS